MYIFPTNDSKTKVLGLTRWVASRPGLRVPEKQNMYLQPNTHVATEPSQVSVLSSHARLAPTRLEGRPSSTGCDRAKQRAKQVLTHARRPPRDNTHAASMTRL